MGPAGPQLMGKVSLQAVMRACACTHSHSGANVNRCATLGHIQSNRTPSRSLEDASSVTSSASHTRASLGCFYLSRALLSHPHTIIPNQPALHREHRISCVLFVVSHNTLNTH